MSEHGSAAGSTHSHDTRYQTRMRSRLGNMFTRTRISSSISGSERDIADDGRSSRASHQSMPGGLPQEEEDQTIQAEQPSVVRSFPGPSVGPEQEVAMGAASILLPDSPGPEESRYHPLAGIHVPRRSRAPTAAPTPRREQEPLPEPQISIFDLDDTEPVLAEPQPDACLPRAPEPNLPELQAVVPPPYTPQQPIN